MILDKAVEEAVHKAVNDLGQSKEAGKRLFLWLEALSVQELNSTENSKQLESALSALQLDKAEIDDES